MNKKLMIGTLALSATTVLGLTGCGDKGGTSPEPTKYTVTFDHDNDDTTQNTVIEFEKGTTVLDSSLIPEVPNKDGFAGVWESFTLSDQSIEVNAVYGDGSQSNPYLVQTDAQFQKILDDYTQYINTTYLGEHGTAVNDEASAITKYVNYKTISLVYSRATASDDWTFVRYDTSNKTYFKLINDIDLSYLNLQDLDLAGRYFAGEITGKIEGQNQNYNIIGFDGAKLSKSSGAMFDTVVDSAFKNLNIKIGGNLGSIAGVACGDVTFGSINVYNDTATPIYVSADDNNESPFVHFALGSGTTLTFNDCANYANYAISADYCGLFLGGYAKDVDSLTFNNCVNYGTIKSAGSVGMLTGNGVYSPAELVVNDGCKNLGVIQAKKDSHLLVSYKTGTGLISTKISEFDTIERLTNKQGEVQGSLSELTTAYGATVSGNNITIQNKTSNENISSGKYQLILSAYAANSKSLDGYMSILANIVIKQDVVEGENYTFENALFGMKDLNTYNSTRGEADKIKSIYADGYGIQQAKEEGITWIALEGYNIYYALIDGIYVFDFGGYEKDQGIENNKLILNKTSTQLNKVIVVYGDKTANIEFIADFNQ